MCFLLLVCKQWDQRGRKNVCDFGVIDDVKVEFHSRACDWIAFLADQEDIKIF